MEKIILTLRHTTYPTETQGWTLPQPAVITIPYVTAPLRRHAGANTDCRIKGCATWLAGMQLLITIITSTYY